MSETPYPLAGQILKRLHHRLTEAKRAEQEKRIEELEARVKYLQTKLEVAQLALEGLGITFI